MERCFGRLQPSDGVSWEFSRAVEGTLQCPAVQHAAESLPRPGGASAFQAHACHGYSTGQAQREDVGNLMPNQDYAANV